MAVSKFLTDQFCASTTLAKFIAQVMTSYLSLLPMMRIRQSPALVVFQCVYHEIQLIQNARNPTGQRVHPCQCISSDIPQTLSNTYSNVPDPLHMVPIKAGDYIEYSGVEFDGATIVYTMVVNIGITTSGNQPGFVRVEDALIGIGDGNADVEAARYRVRNSS